ncbi:MAG: SPOR domain-containing protein, partial [Bacteroidia bacterium]|nr:SPOR domain-containing protein [Bacteroidia bacterium]
FNPNPPPNLNQVLVTDAQSRYFVVLGSFDNRDNAFSFYNNLTQRGISGARIVAPGNNNSRYRVTYNDFTSREEARTQGKIFGKRHNLDLWVLKY